jgi:hypothetical protein
MINIPASEIPIGIGNAFEEQTAFIALLNEKLNAAFGSDVDGNSLGMNPGTFDEDASGVQTPKDPNSRVHYQHVWASMETVTGVGGGQRLIISAREGNTVTLNDGRDPNQLGHRLEDFGFSIARDANGQRIPLSTAFTEDLTKLSVATFLDNGTGIFRAEINGVVFAFDGGVFTVDGEVVRNVVQPSGFTMQHVLDAVNASNAGVRMSFSPSSGQFSMESRTVGATAGRIEFSGPTLFSRMGFGESH